ncbi:unnamed protein product [Brachionus calyciflorus]|uniref:Uncharacterized protein n=1 Tax=Brachionus calyciflorus TaxID=104777 RepID=A0A814DDG9_9BILA|nr:unnamed protein product [Brachionus calyciflorus]
MSVLNKNSPELKEEVSMNEDDLKVYANHLKAYTDALTEVFELNKTTEQINLKIITLNRKRLALTQKLNSIKNYGTQRFGNKALYPNVQFVAVSINPELNENNPQLPMLSLTPTTQKRTLHCDEQTDEDFLNYSKNLKFFYF